MTTTTHLALPLIAAGQAQKHVTHNEALLAVDALLHAAVKDKDLAAPPGAPAEGDRYIVAPAPAGAWAGKAGQVAAWQDGIWRFYAPKAGWIAFVVDELQLYHFNGAAWAPGVLAITNLQNLTLLGIGTMADATNPFSTKLNNVLHAAKTVAEGGNGSIQVKLSKESAAKTASHLFQTNFSGRAEFGLTGDDNFHVKTSADGATWVDALVLAAATGAATFAAGATFGGLVLTPASAAGGAGLRVPHGAAPSAPANGDLWSTTAGWFARTNGATQQLVMSDGPATLGNVTVNGSYSNALSLAGVRAKGSVGIGISFEDTSASGTSRNFALINAFNATGAFEILYSSVAGGTPGLSGYRLNGSDGSSVFGGVVRPASDNGLSLGNASFRWSQLFAGTTTINTSNAEEKTNFRSPDEAVLLAALDTEQSFYQWAESVAHKGEASARWHFGPTAQSFAAACRARGVDPNTLGVYCEDPELAPVKKTRAVERERFVGRKRRRRIVETVVEEHEVLEPTGRTQYGLRLDQFDRLLQEARWRVLTGRLVHAPPNV